MKKKIERVITSCNYCRFSKEFKEIDGNNDYLLVCCHENDKGIKSDVFILQRDNINLLRNTPDIEIPDNCPLIDFKETSKK